MGQSLYDVQSASRILPLVRTIVKDVVTEFRALRSAGREQRRIEVVLDGPDAHRHLRTMRAAVEESSARIEGYLKELEALGIEIRDLEIGLVDFPTLMRGEPAYLCWKVGEDEIRWWHAAGQGVADRQPLPADVPSLAPMPTR
jgi:hypothetical protein